MRHLIPISITSDDRVDLALSFDIKYIDIYALIMEQWPKEWDPIIRVCNLRPGRSLLSSFCNASSDWFTDSWASTA